MTTKEKLVEVEREFWMAWRDVKASLTDTGYGVKCNRCGRIMSTHVNVERRISRPEKPTSGGAKACKKWERETAEWVMDLHSTHTLYVCPDRPACRLRRAKNIYRQTRRDEKAQRRRERALRV